MLEACCSLAGTACHQQQGVVSAPPADSTAWHACMDVHTFAVALEMIHTYSTAWSVAARTTPLTPSPQHTHPRTTFGAHPDPRITKLRHLVLLPALFHCRTDCSYPPSAASTAACWVDTAVRPPATAGPRPPSPHSPTSTPYSSAHSAAMSCVGKHPDAGPAAQAAATALSLSRRSGLLAKRSRRCRTL